MFEEIGKAFQALADWFNGIVSHDTNNVAENLTSQGKTTITGLEGRRKNDYDTLEESMPSGIDLGVGDLRPLDGYFRTGAFQTDSVKEMNRNLANTAKTGGRQRVMWELPDGSSGRGYLYTDRGSYNSNYRGSYAKTPLKIYGYEPYGGDRYPYYRSEGLGGSYTARTAKQFLEGIIKQGGRVRINDIGETFDGTSLPDHFRNGGE